MKNKWLILLRSMSIILLLTAASLTFAGCELIGDIFKAGMWVGIFIVLIIIGLIYYIMGKFRK